MDKKITSNAIKLVDFPVQEDQFRQSSLPMMLNPTYYNS